jgi:Leu/Phe-tRNA-protein transferase
MKNCSFKTIDACHQLIYSRSRGLKKVESEDKGILELRSKVPSRNMKTICNHHKAKLDTKFSSLIKKCSNPFELHSAVATSSLKIITPEFYSKTACLEQKAVPGEKLW